MLATLFDFPYAERRKLTFWSMASPEQVGAVGITEGGRRSWSASRSSPGSGRRGRARRRASRGFHHGTRQRCRDVTTMEYLGTLVLLIVGGNDTTRDSISGGAEREPGGVPEAARPRPDPEHGERDDPLADPAGAQRVLAGKQIKKGDKVVMWYVSGNRDESVIELANEFLIDRKNARQHLSFGWGVHFCLGSRLAEMQLRILWEEILERFPARGGGRQARSGPVQLA